MADHTELRRLASEAAREDLGDAESFEAGEDFQQLATPQAVLALLNEIAELDRARREGRQLLRRMAKLAREEAGMAGLTRLLRVIESVDDYLKRTHRQEDVLR